MKKQERTPLPYAPFPQEGQLFTGKAPLGYYTGHGTENQVSKIEIWQPQNQRACPLAATPPRGAASCEFLQLQADSFGTPISNAG